MGSSGRVWSADSPPHKPSHNLLFKQVLAATCSSFFTALCVNPLVVVKIRLQTSSGGSIASVLASIVKTTGVRGLWAGCSTALIQSVPNVAVYMVTYENLSTYLTQRASHGTASLVPVVAGSLARFICVTIISPIERIRTIQSSGSSGSMHSIGSSIVSAEGVAGLYKGWPSMILRDVPFSALYWLCYENCKIHLSDLHRSIWDDHSLAGTVSPIGALLAGGVSGGSAALITHPFDVVKSILEVEQGTSSEMSTSLIRRLYKQGALYRGLGLRLLIVVPASALMISSYEFMKSIL